MVHANLATQTGPHAYLDSDTDARLGVTGRKVKGRDVHLKVKGRVAQSVAVGRGKKGGKGEGGWVGKRTIMHG